MPVQRVSRTFKDISLSFVPHPVTRDVIPLKNENAIARSVKNLVLTHLQERPFNPFLGSRLGESLFELMDTSSASLISEEITETIDNFEPRVKLRNVDVIPYYDSNAFDVTIVYDIVGIDAQPQSLNFLLESFR
jgi:phage baseplate assembly protein W